ncbi:MAG: succinylglutamate desuccinylase/aspartoacylase family protein [bacterium]
MKDQGITLRYIEILQEYFGTNLENVVRIKGKVNGPKVFISAGVHGNEHCGLKAFAEIIPFMKNVDCGEIIFAIGNPPACLKNIRFTKKELNLNRFGVDDDLLSEEQKTSYEYGRAQLYKQLIAESSALLDIHSGTQLREAVMIGEHSADFITDFMPSSFPYMIYGFDAIEAGAWDGYALSLGKPGITLECGYHEDPEGPTRAKEAITSFLKTFAIISGECQPVIPKKKIQMFQMYLTTTNFILARDFYSLETLSAGELIGVDGKVQVHAPQESIMFFPHNCTGAKEEAFLLGKMV